eukprot:c18925_g1_i3.p1 GENE.c18925_g1_i3~~c18925_g1_i3.p1  ORF type:complete len:211 (-),score=4.75 c18925_g1_i3:89-721(-)
MRSLMLKTRRTLLVNSTKRKNMVMRNFGSYDHNYQTNHENLFCRKQIRRTIQKLLGKKRVFAHKNNFLFHSVNQEIDSRNLMMMTTMETSAADENNKYCFCSFCGDEFLFSHDAVVCPKCSSAGITKKVLHLLSSNNEDEDIAFKEADFGFEVEPNLLISASSSSPSRNNFDVENQLNAFETQINSRVKFNQYGTAAEVISAEELAWLRS